MFRWQTPMSNNNVIVEKSLTHQNHYRPNCNGIVKLPEAGKMLMCEYYGTPIKPVDIFEKVKTLIQ